MQEPAPISEAELPLTLPDMDDFKPSGTPDPPLAKAGQWVATTDPATGERWSVAVVVRVLLLLLLLLCRWWVLQWWQHELQLQEQLVEAFL
jgi:hypothetical protein